MFMWRKRNDPVNSTEYLDLINKITALKGELGLVVADVKRLDQENHDLREQFRKKLIIATKDKKAELEEPQIINSLQSNLAFGHGKPL